MFIYLKIIRYISSNFQFNYYQPCRIVCSTITNPLTHKNVCNSFPYLTYLTLNTNFNVPLPTLPSTLTHLTFESNFN